MKRLCLLIILCTFVRLDPLWAQTDASSLLGNWQLSLRLTGPAASSTGPRAASGKLELQLLEMGSAKPAHQYVYSVTYDTTLHVMFGAPRAGPAQAVLKEAGKVELAFNPFVDHGAFRLTGVLSGDSITGQWQRTNFADDGYRGAFTMVRRREPRGVR